MKRTHLALLGMVLAIVSVCEAVGRQSDGPRKPAPGAPPAKSAARSDEEKAIRASVDAFAQAFQNNDARAIADLFTEDGEAVDAEGGTIEGRGALEAHYASRFAER